MDCSKIWMNTTCIMLAWRKRCTVRRVQPKLKYWLEGTLYNPNMQLLCYTIAMKPRGFHCSTAFGLNNSCRLESRSSARILKNIISNLDTGRPLATNPQPHSTCMTRSIDISSVCTHVAPTPGCRRFPNIE